MTNFFNRRHLLRAAVAGTAAGASISASAMVNKPLANEAPLLGPKPGVALLARNENPYGPSQKARKAISNAGDMGAYYPGEANFRLMDAIGERHSLTREHIVIGTGSGEVLSAIALMKGESGEIVAPGLYWDTTTLYAEKKGANIIRVDMKEDLSIDLKAIEESVTDRTALVHICNPNNPTGEVLDGDTLRAFCKRVSRKATVLIDEAYNELTDRPDYTSMVDLVRDGLNVVVTRTFSKIYGMAGIRVGYAIASPETAEKLRGYVMTWVAGTGLTGALACYEDQEFMSFSKSKIVAAREMVMDAARTNNLHYYPSQTNFVFIKLPGDAERFREKMAERKILVRGIYGDYTNWSRVSMGLLEDVERYVTALPEVLNA